MSLPLVAIVGAPNVGKSTLFNRLVGRRRAIVTDEPGVTRDRLYGEVRSAPRPFALVDTGGLARDGGAPLGPEIERQALLALDEARLVLFVIDARAGITANDLEVAALLRRRAHRVIVVANKIDAPALEPLMHELHRLGLGEPVAVSAEHGLGIDDLLEKTSAAIRDVGEPLEASGPADHQQPIRIALVGRPNAGKSSLLNRLLGQERMMVSEIPGTTRDAVDTLLTRDGHRYLLVDTAGIRRKSRVRATAEALSVVSARKSIARADVVALVVDAVQGFAAQDAHIAGLAVEAARPLLVVINKWDLVEDREATAKHWEQQIREQLNFVKNVPLLLASAVSGQRVVKLLERAEQLYHEAGRRVPTPLLNRWLERVAKGERASPARGRSVNLLYAAQTGVHPPRFVLFCSDPRRVHFSLRRYLENSLREAFDFGAAPIQLTFRRRTRKGR